MCVLRFDCVDTGNFRHSKASKGTITKALSAGFGSAAPLQALSGNTQSGVLLGAGHYLHATTMYSQTHKTKVEQVTWLTPPP